MQQATTFTSATRPRVVSMRRHAAPYDRSRAVRIDRATLWGNPFVMRSKSPAERERVIAAYGKLLYQRIRSGEVTRDALARLCGRNLECWCAPLNCHGDRIADAAAAAGGTDGRWNAWLEQQANLHD